MIKEFFTEFWDEISDFGEDFYEHLFRIEPQEDIPQKDAVINGIKVKVRPAYLFAERIDNILKVIFGLSIIISGITATFLGFLSLSDLAETLINTLVGRILMVLIGLSYGVVGLWRILHLADKRV